MCIVSVVVPAYNAEKTIAKTIDSVLNQTFHDFELIIINDGSTDDTLVVVSQFNDDRVKCFSYENSGPQKSRNRGLEKASGQYIAFLDSDDLWTPDKLELQVKKLRENPRFSVVYSWTNVIDEKGDFVRRGGYFTHEGDVFLSLFLINFIESGSNPLITTEALHAVGGFDEEIVAGQDWDLYLSLANSYPFTVIKKPQVLYRKSTSSSSWSTNFERLERGMQQVLNKNIDRRSDLDVPHIKAFLSNSYKYLLFESLQSPVSKKKAWKAVRYLWNLVLNDLSIITKKIFLKLILKILKHFILSDREFEFLNKKAGSLFDITSLYGYLTTSI